MNPNALTLLQQTELRGNQRIAEINQKIAALEYERYCIEQSMQRCIGFIIEHADIIVEVPMQYKSKGE